MLDTLRSIIEEVNTARNLDQVLEIVVHRVKKSMAVDVCSVYLREASSGLYILMATEGLNPGSVGEVRLRENEGLVGSVAAGGQSINLMDANLDSRNRYFSVTGEERFHGFLGVPVVQHGKVLGVLVVQQRAVREFNEQDVTFMMSLAAQLAGTVTHASNQGGFLGTLHKLPAGNRRLEGVSGSDGVAIGIAVTVFPAADLDAVPNRSPDNINDEIESFKRAIEVTRAELDRVAEGLTGYLPNEELAIFEAYKLMLSDSSLVQETIKRIVAGNWAPGALRQTIEAHVSVFDQMADGYLRERASDIRDLGTRLLQAMENRERDTIEYPPNTILIGEEITPAHVVEVPQGRLAGIVSGTGSTTSHVAILARAFNVPAVLGVGAGCRDDFTKRELIIDGYRGWVYVQPAAAVREEYQRLQREEREFEAGLSSLREFPAITPDGEFVPLYVNTGLVSDIKPALRCGAEGIGLYRTEFPFMLRNEFPSEDEQYEVYRQVLAAFAPLPVTLRSLDIGGDKQLPYLPVQEDNPFLGWRGMRLLLDNPEIFLTQLRGMLRANVGYENLRIMFPMVSNVEELDKALAMLGRAHDDLAGEGIATPWPQVGVMIEVPSAAFQAGAMAKRVDFLSIGTNDLTQYILAVDRNNSRVAGLFDSLHPAVLRTLKMIVDQATAEGVPVGVCGEMAGDPKAVVLLLGMGVENFSTSASAVPRIKLVVRSVSRASAAELLARVLEMEETGSVRRLMVNALDDAGLGGLVRAGK